MTNRNIDDFNPSDERDVNFLLENQEIISNSIAKIDLRLDGLTILTEAATGNWIFTPFIAGMAKAKEIICFTKDSKYGNSKKIIENFNKLTKFFGFENLISVHEKLTNELIHKADIITNSGLLRPINKKIIDSMKNTAVISLMWEPWEFREGDLELSYCWKKGISIIGVNEDNDILNVMQYSGQNLMKIFKDYKISIKDKKIILVGENKSALYMINPLIESGASVYCVSNLLTKEIKQLGVNVIGSELNEKQIEPYLKKCDLIIINSAPQITKVIGNEGLSVSTLQQLCPNVTVIVYFGNIDFEKLVNAKIRCYPYQNSGIGYMNWTLDNLGPRPTIELNSLGLKVGEILASNRLKGINIQKSEENALKSKFCLGFSEQQKKIYNHPNFE